MKHISLITAVAGAGKTTEIKNKVAQLANEGLAPEEIGVSTYTRAARGEIVGRSALIWDVDPDYLQSHCMFKTITASALYMLKSGGHMKNREIIDYTNEDHRCLIENAFNEKIKYQYSGTDPLTTGPYGQALLAWSLARNSGRNFRDIYQEMRHLNAINNLRTTKRNNETMPYDDAWKAIDRYERLKRCDGLVDFTDLLMLYAGKAHDIHIGSYNSGSKPIGDVPDVKAYFFDEHQDASPLSNQVAKRLSSHDNCEQVVIVGDPGQSIYGFLGSSPSCFDEWKYDEVIRLERSYRCPYSIGKFAEKALTEQCVRPHKFRDIEWRDMMEGKELDLKSGCHVFGEGPQTIDFYTKHKHWQWEKTYPGSESWLILARTNYQVKKIIASCHKHGLSVLKLGGGSDRRVQEARGYRAMEELRNDRTVSAEQLNDMMQTISVKSWSMGTPIEVLNKGAKSSWKRHWKEKTLIHDAYFKSDLAELGFTDDALKRIDSGSRQAVSYFFEHGFDYDRQMLRNDVNPFDKPKVRVGTIHQSKGLEADHVTLFTQTAGRLELGAQKDREKHDEECRLAYVALTRARKWCFVADPKPRKHRSVNQKKKGRYHMEGLRALINHRRAGI